MFFALGVELAEVSTHMLHVVGGGDVIIVTAGVVVIIPGKSDQVGGRVDARTAQVNHAVVHEHEGLPARALPCRLLTLAIPGDDRTHLPKVEVVEHRSPRNANLTYEQAVDLVGAC